MTTTARRSSSRAIAGGTSIRRPGQSVAPDDADAGLDPEPDSPDRADDFSVFEDPFSDGFSEALSVTVSDPFSDPFDDPSLSAAVSPSPEDDALFTAARRSFLAHPEPLKWIAGGANAFRTGPEPHRGHCSGAGSWTPWMTSNRRPQAAQS